MKIILMQDTLMYYSKQGVSVSIPDNADVSDKSYINKSDEQIYYSTITLEL